MANYATKQKELIIEIFKNNPNEKFTSEDIYYELKKAGKDVSLATIYRQLDNLVNNNVISKFMSVNSLKACYKLILPVCQKSEHVHLMCIKCHKFIHLDCSEFKHLMNHLAVEHDFMVDKLSLVINGYCKECRE